MNILNVIKYYSNIIISSYKRTKVIRYDKHTYSSFFEKERKYADNIIHVCDDANAYIKKYIESNKPFMLARYGSTELYATEIFDLKLRFKYNNALNMLCNNAGFFPYNYNDAEQFKNLLIKASENVDIFAIWNMFMEEQYIKKYMRDVYLTQLRFIEPWFAKNPWTEALKGKKVLVIHPFSETIIEQYKKREYLFENKKILPNFELEVIKAVQTIAGEKDDRFNTWFDALNWMYEETIKKEFDVALIGCGAYGMPLASMIKNAGKQAIHMGGVLQILFGIKGARWDNDPIVSNLYNEYWVRPSNDEKIINASSVEGGCYW